MFGKHSGFPISPAFRQAGMAGNIKKANKYLLAFLVLTKMKVDKRLSTFIRTSMIDEVVMQCYVIGCIFAF
jgi:hypothetical protein